MSHSGIARPRTDRPLRTRVERDPPEPVGPRGGNLYKGMHLSKYHSDCPELVTKLRHLKLTVHQIASTMNVSVRTLYNWLEDIPEFRQAWERGGNLADANVASTLRQLCEGYYSKATKVLNSGEQVQYDQFHEPSVTAIKYWLNNRQPDLWRDRMVQEITANKDALLPPVINMIAVDPDGTSSEELTITPEEDNKKA